MKDFFLWVFIIAVGIVSLAFTAICFLVNPKGCLIVWFFMWLFRKLGLSFAK